MWATLPSSGTFGWRAQSGDETPYYSGGIFTTQISLWDLSHCLWEWGQPFLCLLPSYHSQCGFFYKFLAIRLLFNYSSVCYSGCLFYILAVIPVWSQEEVSAASIFSGAILDISTCQLFLHSLWLIRPAKDENSTFFCYSFSKKMFYNCIVIKWINLYVCQFIYNCITLYVIQPIKCLL